MKFDMKPQDKAFLKLAEAVAAGEGSSKDRAELELMMQDDPELEMEFVQFQRNLRDERLAEFWSVAVRVMVGTACPEEVKQIESLRTSDPKRWEKYLAALAFVDEMASRHDSANSLKTEPMPSHVRQKLLSELRPETRSTSSKSK